MKNAIFSSLLLVLLTVSATVLAGEQMQGMNHADMKNMTMNAQQPMQWADGVVMKVIAQRGKVTLQHGDIPNVMPAMTMDYRVQDTQALKSLHKGDKVRFILEKQNDNYLVTKIELAK